MKSKLYFLLLVLLVPFILAFNHEEKKVVYDPPKPKDAPDQIRNAVMLGYNILINTQKYAADYVGNDLNCHNCHFDVALQKEEKTAVFLMLALPLNILNIEHDRVML